MVHTYIHSSSYFSRFAPRCGDIPIQRCGIEIAINFHVCKLRDINKHRIVMMNDLSMTNLKAASDTTLKFVLE